MPFIPNTYHRVKKFFEPKKDNNIPEHLLGVWNLEKVKNRSIMMSLNNADFNTDKRQITIKLYEKGNWLFQTDDYFTQWACKLIGYTYVFTFNEDYTHADIDIKLGKIPIWMPRSVMHWTMDYVDGKFVRTTKTAFSVHTYEATKVNDNNDILQLNSSGINELYYVE